MLCIAGKYYKVLQKSQAEGGIFTDENFWYLLNPYRVDVDTTSFTVTRHLYRLYASIEFHLDGTILTANGNFLALTGYRLSEIQGKNHAIFVDAAYAESEGYKTFWDRLRADEAFFDEFPRAE